MSEKQQITYGRFVWRELMSANVDAAKRFYGELFGWTVKQWGEKEPYYLLNAGDKGVAGLMAVRKDMPMPPHWTSYVSANDVDACVERAKSAGGKIPFGPVDIPTIGRIAFILDPNGAKSAVIKPERRDAPPESMPGPGEFCWESLQTPNPKTDVAFYKKVYGWSEGDFGGSITLGTADQTHEGGVAMIASVSATPSGMPANWISYVAVDALPAARDRVKKLGGSVIEEAIQVPTMGTFALIKDSESAMLCLFEAERRG
jgi:predicted enzyme related to lactoylglutathione lyase